MTRKAKASSKPNKQPGESSALDKAGDGAAMILDLVGKAAKLSGLPYLSDAAGVALKLVQIAQAVKENKEGFQGLTDDATQLVAVFYRSYQGAPNQEDWLNSEGIRTSAKDLERCLDDILLLGKKMEKRNVFLRILYYLADANTIQKYRQKLASATTQFQVAAQLDAREILLQIFKGQEELREEVSQLAASSGTEAAPAASVGKAIENEHRARRRIEIENVKTSGVAFGEGSVTVENGRTMGETQSKPESRNSDRPRATPSPENAESNHPDIRMAGIETSGISFGSGDVNVRNWG